MATLVPKYGNSVKIVDEDGSLKRKDIVEAFKKPEHPTDPTLKNVFQQIKRIQKYENNTNWFVLFSATIKATDLYHKHIRINGNMYQLLPPKELLITFKIQWLPVESNNMLQEITKSLCVNSSIGKHKQTKELKCEDGIGIGVYNITIEYNPEKIGSIDFARLSGRKMFNKNPVFITKYGDPIRCQFCSDFGHIKRQCEKFKKFCQYCKKRGHCQEECSMALILDTDSQVMGINNDENENELEETKAAVATKSIALHNDEVNDDEAKNKQVENNNKTSTIMTTQEKKIKSTTETATSIKNTEKKGKKKKEKKNQNKQEKSDKNKEISTTSKAGKRKDRETDTKESDADDKISRIDENEKTNELPETSYLDSSDRISYSEGEEN